MWMWIHRPPGVNGIPYKIGHHSLSYHKCLCPRLTMSGSAGCLDPETEGASRSFSYSSLPSFSSLFFLIPYSPSFPFSFFLSSVSCTFRSLFFLCFCLSLFVSFFSFPFPPSSLPSFLPHFLFHLSPFLALSHLAFSLALSHRALSRLLSRALSFSRSVSSSLYDIVVHARTAMSLDECATEARRAPT